VGVCCDAFSSRDIHERPIARFMGLLRNASNGGELFGRVEKALIAARDVVVDLDAKNVRRLSIGNDGVRVFRSQTVRTDANKVGPVLLRLIARQRKTGYRHLQRNQTKFAPLFLEKASKLQANDTLRVA